MTTARVGVRRSATPWLLVLGYVLGVGGSLWDWREHLAGVTFQPPHVAIDLGGLLVIGALAFSGGRPRAGSFLPLYVLLAVAAVLVLGPFGLMLLAPRAEFTRSFMAWMMTGSGPLLLTPLLAVAAAAAWRWLRLDRISPARLAAAIGIVIVAAGAVFDLAWHQANPMVTEMSMDMLTLPGHQLLLAGFTLGLIGSAAMLLPPAWSPARPRT